MKNRILTKTSLFMIIIFVLTTVFGIMPVVNYTHANSPAMAACGIHDVSASGDHASTYLCNIPPCSNRVVPYCLALCPESSSHGIAACGIHDMSASGDHASTYLCNIPPCSNRVVPYCFALCPESSSHGTTIIIGGCGHTYTSSESYDHRAETCPTNSNGDSCDYGSYYACFPHTHEYQALDAALEALESELSSAYTLVAEIEVLKAAAENYETSTTEEINIRESIIGGLSGLLVTVTGSIATVLSIKAIILTGGTATPAAVWSAKAGLVTAAAGATAANQDFTTAYNGMVARYKKIKCPEPLCQKLTTKAELDGWSNTTGEHAYITCKLEALEKDGSMYTCSVLYRKCRGGCPNFAAHAWQCNGCLLIFRFDTETDCTHSSKGHSWQQQP